MFDDGNYEDGWLESAYEDKHGYPEDADYLDAELDEPDIDDSDFTDDDQYYLNDVDHAEALEL